MNSNYEIIMADLNKAISLIASQVTSLEVKSTDINRSQAKELIKKAKELTMILEEETF